MASLTMVYVHAMHEAAAKVVDGDAWYDTEELAACLRAAGVECNANDVSRLILKHAVLKVYLDLKSNVFGTYAQAYGRKRFIQIRAANVPHNWNNMPSLRPLEDRKGGLRERPRPPPSVNLPGKLKSAAQLCIKSDRNKRNTPLLSPRPLKIPRAAIGSARARICAPPAPHAPHAPPTPPASVRPAPPAKPAGVPTAPPALQAPTGAPVGLQAAPARATVAAKQIFSVSKLRGLFGDPPIKEHNIT
jgi:hypothetical protein